MKNIHEIDEIRNIAQDQHKFYIDDWHKSKIEDWHEFYYPKMRYTKNDAQVIPSGVATKIMYDGKDYDTKSCYEVVNARFVAPFDGYYHVDASLLLTSATYTANKTYSLQLYKNNTVNSGHRGEIEANITKYIYGQISCDVNLLKDEFIHVIFYQDSGSNIALHTSYYFNFFSVHRI
jgi:hypothetical protein